MTSLEETYPVLARPGTQLRRKAQLPFMNQAWNNTGTVAMMGNGVNGFIRINDTLYSVDHNGVSYIVEEFLNDEDGYQKFATIAEIEAWATATATVETAPESDEISDDEYSEALSEFTRIATFAGGMHSNKYQTSTDYEFVCWFEDEEDIPFDFSSSLIQYQSEWDQSMNAYKFNMTLGYKVKNA